MTAFSFRRGMASGKLMYVCVPADAVCLGGPPYQTPAPGGVKMRRRRASKFAPILRKMASRSGPYGRDTAR